MSLSSSFICLSTYLSLDLHLLPLSLTLLSGRYIFSTSITLKEPASLASLSNTFLSTKIVSLRCDVLPFRDIVRQSFPSMTTHTVSSFVFDLHFL